MSRKNFKVVNRYTRTVEYQGSYSECQTFCNEKDKAFRKTHRIEVINNKINQTNEN